MHKCMIKDEITKAERCGICDDRCLPGMEMLAVGWTS